MIEVNHCINRIGYRGATGPTLDTLRGLQQAFLLTVPFENLDIHLGREIRLSPDRIYDKIVTRRRGGFCYECNILFYELLNRLGFQAEYLSGRMVQGRSVGAEYDHMALIVHLNTTIWPMSETESHAENHFALTGRIGRPPKAR